MAVKIFIVIMLAICLAKYGMAHRYKGSQRLQQHYTLTPYIMYPVFFAGLVTSVDTMIFVSVFAINTGQQKHDTQPKGFFLTNMISGGCDFTLKLSIMFAYFLIIKHVYDKLNEEHRVPCRENNQVFTNFDEIDTYGTKTNTHSSTKSDSLSTKVF